MTHPANEPRGKYKNYFDNLCATCDRPIPYLYRDEPTKLLSLGWVQFVGGAWGCPVCEDEWEKSPELFID